MKNYFVTGIQTKQQLEMFEKNASKVICIDATHRTNQYAFSLRWISTSLNLNEKRKRKKEKKIPGNCTPHLRSCHIL